VKPLKIGFLTTLGINIGDEFIREGIRAILDRLGKPYYPLYVNKHDKSTLYRPIEDEVHTVSDKYWDADVFIQAGAPVYWYLHRGTATSLNSEWYAWAWKERILNKEHQSHPVFLNIGAGSCQPWGGSGEDFLANADCAQFAMDIATRSSFTAVRDPLASKILSALSIQHKTLPCPAFLAAERHQPARPNTDVLGVNLMPLGSHYDLTEDFDTIRWALFCHELTLELRRLGDIVFICHDSAEREFVESFAQPADEIFFSTSWRDYLDIYSACRLVVANRVHGAVCAAGFGVPSIIMGNDTRAQIGEYIGLQIYRSGEVTVPAVIDRIQFLYDNRKIESDRLVLLRKQTLDQYVEFLRPCIETAYKKSAVSTEDVKKQGRVEKESISSLLTKKRGNTVGENFIKQLSVCEADRAARLDHIHRLEKNIEEINADRAARLDHIHSLEKNIEEINTDRAARLDHIHSLEKNIEEINTDRAARLDHIHNLEKAIKDINADRDKCRELVQQLDNKIQGYEKENHDLQGRCLNLEARYQEKHEEACRKDDIIKNLSAELDEIKSSPGWKVIAWLTQILKGGDRKWQ
jgi:hypothetical protein